jgi:hypothetical protein
MKKLKTFLVVLFVGIVTTMYSQINQPNPFASDTQNVYVQEEYLASLIQDGQVRFCKIDSINDWQLVKDDWQLVKDMEITFTDSSMFYDCYFESEFYTTIIAKFKDPYAIYCEIYDLYGNKMIFTEQELKKFQILKRALDAKLQTTEITMK